MEMLDIYEYATPRYSIGDHMLYRMENSREIPFTVFQGMVC